MRRIDLRDKDARVVVTHALEAGGVVVLPTDTIYGLSAALLCREAYDRILALKGYDHARSFVNLAESTDMVARYVAGWGSTSAAKLRGVWPAPLTAVLPSGGLAPKWVGETIAFRVPKAPELTAIIRALGQPILSTSVNRSGEKPLTSVDAIQNDFGSDIDLLVAGEITGGGAPSTIVDFTGEGPRVIRQGAYDWPATAKPSN